MILDCHSFSGRFLKLGQQSASIMIEIWNKLSQRVGVKNAKMIAFLSFIIFLAAIIQFLIIMRLFNSAILYVLIPYSVSIFVAWFRPSANQNSLLYRYCRHLAYALMILLSTSILLGEGFVCVVFFFPIYILIVSITFLVKGSNNRRKDNKNIMSVAMPLIIAVMSLEGTSTSFSLPRQSFIEVNRVTPLSVNEIKQNLAKPFNLEKDRHWVLSIFPMPYQIDAGSLQAGDIHKIYTRYHRWFVTNTHEGEAELLIEEVTDNQVKTKLISDTTYFSSYLTMSGTQITLTEVAQGQTKITLRIDYLRKLDPAWYFHSLTQFGVSKMANLLLDEVMIRD